MRVASAVAFLHSRSILHRDVKSLNFLVQRQRTGAETRAQVSRPTAADAAGGAPSPAAAPSSGGDSDSLATRFHEARPLHRTSTAATSTTVSNAPYARGLRHTQRYAGTSSTVESSGDVNPLFRNDTVGFLRNASHRPLDRQARTLSAGPGQLRRSARSFHPALLTMSGTGPIERRVAGERKSTPRSRGRSSLAGGGETPEVALPSHLFVPAPEVEVKIADFELSRRFDAVFAAGGRQASVSGPLPISRVFKSEAVAKPASEDTNDSGATFSTLHLSTDHSDRSASSLDRQPGVCSSICASCGCAGRGERSADVEAGPGQAGAAEYALEGTANWAAPEVLCGEPYTAASDCAARPAAPSCLAPLHRCADAHPRLRPRLRGGPCGVGVLLAPGAVCAVQEP